ncbi:MAG: GWxTD domain-containing protein [Candidatus Aminicenantes bacterium]
MRKSVFVAAAALALAVSFACSRYPVPKNLDEESSEFYSQARYIITKEERKSFLRLVPAERFSFIREFWERRDPTPGTDRNEFKEDYLGRIQEANRLFKEGSTPGWLQERGEVYVTLGRPDHRESYPRGIDFYGKPQEIWWYGFFPVVFVDENWSGNYRLTALGARHITEIAAARAEERARSDGSRSEPVPELVFEIASESADGRTAFSIKIPYKAIWFKAEGDTFKTTLDVSLSVSGRSGKTVWETEKAFDVSASRIEGLKLFEQTYEMRVEADLPAGTYKLNVEITNRTGNSRGKKSLDFEI